VAVPAGASSSSDAGSRAAPSAGRQFWRDHGYLVSNPTAYARLKSLAAAGHSTPASGSSTLTPSSPSDPAVLVSVRGQSEGDLAPPDPTGAAGPHSYIQIINLRMAIYDRSGVRLAAGPIEQLVGGFHFNYSDPQMLWDAHTQRFFYLIWDTTNATMRWGFSKTNDPRSLGDKDFCKYVSAFGYDPSDAPDYPKLGQTNDFLLIGVNFFAGFETYQGGDLLWIAKPQVHGPITNCPSSLNATGRFPNVTNPDGSHINAPIPAQQADPSGTGYVVGVPDVTTTPSANYVTIYHVTKNPETGEPDLSRPQLVRVARYSLPPGAPECDTDLLLDTLDGRLERAVSAIDPSTGSVAIWTAHAVAGGAGSEERWYEITPTPFKAPTIAQAGRITSSSLYVWNGAISPDRTVTPQAAAHGDAMVTGFNTSSPTRCPAIRMVSKAGSGPQSGMVQVKRSATPDVYSACGTTCRWGDYSGASPDPGASLNAPTGSVWLTNEWTNSSFWDTWIWQATP
jgi:hypothetical protein